MYLISLYFDDKSNKIIQKLIDKTATKSNKFMINGKVPPHITIASFQTNEEKKIIEELDRRMKEIKSGSIMWASIGIFKSSVVFLVPVLNEYLHNLCFDINKSISLVENTSISKYYLPF